MAGDDARRLGQRLSEITTLAQTLARLDDELGRRIQACEDLLRRHNPETRVSWGIYEGGEIRWGRHGGHWRFLWIDTDGPVPLLGAPRYVRAAFSHMIDDVDQLLAVVVAALQAEIRLREKT